jgi:hypothetical protein
MTMLSKLRKKVHRKSWEMCTALPSVPTAGSFVDCLSDAVFPDNVFMVNGVNSIWSYTAKEDSWAQLPNSGVAGAYGAGSCGKACEIGMLGGSITNTPTAGTTNTLTTSRTIVRSLAGAAVWVVSGTGVGYIGTVASNTLGANSVFTVTPASLVPFDTTTTFQVFSGSLWFFNAGTSAVGFSVYDRATNAWTAKSVTGLPTAWGTCGQLISTGSKEGVFESGTASAGSSTTTLVTNKNWSAANCYTNNQVRIVTGTGAGQVRTIASNTTNTLTISAPWTVTPDNTSTYVIEGNDDSIYLLGNNAVTLYKYSISGNTWATVAPGVARAAAMGAGGSADWVSSVDAWSIGTTTAAIGGKQPGRFIYSMRGVGSSALDVYDIALNTWQALSYGGQQETFNTGSCSFYDGHGSIYIMKEATGRFFKFDIDRNTLYGLAVNPYPQSTTLAAAMFWIDTYTDPGGGSLDFLYQFQHSRTELLRMLLV